MRALAAVVALLVVGPSLAFAQFRPVRAELTPIVESEAHPGGKARAALSYGCRRLCTFSRTRRAMRP